MCVCVCVGVGVGCTWILFLSVHALLHLASISGFSRMPGSLLLYRSCMQCGQWS